MPKTVNPDPAWTDTLDVPLPHETMDAADVAVPDTRLLANDKWLKKEFGARLDALERAVWPTSIQAELTASETDSAAHLWRFEYTLSTNRGSISTATLDFGDGSPAVTLSNPAQPGFVTHAYPDADATYTAVLTVQTSEGVSQRVERVVGTLPLNPGEPFQLTEYFVTGSLENPKENWQYTARLNTGEETFYLSGTKPIPASNWAALSNGPTDITDWETMRNAPHALHAWGGISNSYVIDTRWTGEAKTAKLSGGSYSPDNDGIRYFAISFLGEGGKQIGDTVTRKIVEPREDYATRVFNFTLDVPAGARTMRIASTNHFSLYFVHLSVEA